MKSSHDDTRLDWFNEARYGMFIHWGAYAVPARGEWIMNRERIPKTEYTERYVKKWKAEKYDPQEWVDLAREAGMKYLVLTTRHHDGFSLWPSKVNPYNAGKLGPKRDLIAAYAKVVRKSGLKLGFYYSGASWPHPDYPGPFFRDWPKQKDWKSESHRRAYLRYYREELRELMTSYGPVDLLWYDGCLPDDFEGAETNREIKRLQPRILINARNGAPFDIDTCEQEIKASTGPHAWEACMTLNDNWGYHAGDANWKSPKQVVRMLTETAAGAGNLLLNVGPKADGTIPKESAKILREVGQWLKRNGEFLPRSSRSPFALTTNWGRTTTKGNRIYLHVLTPSGPEVCLTDVKNRVLSARYLESGKRISFKQAKNRIVLKGLSFPPSEKIATTLVLEVKGKPQISI